MVTTRAAGGGWDSRAGCPVTGLPATPTAFQMLPAQCVLPKSESFLSEEVHPHKKSPPQSFVTQAGVHLYPDQSVGQDGASKTACKQAPGGLATAWRLPLTTHIHKALPLTAEVQHPLYVEKKNVSEVALE